MATTEERLNSLEQQVSAVTAKIDTFIGEMRDRDNRRSADIVELRQKHDADIEELRQKHDADIKELNTKIDSKFDSLSNQIHNLTIAAVVGFGAIALAVGGLVVSLLK